MRRNPRQSTGILSENLSLQNIQTNPIIFIILRRLKIWFLSYWKSINDARLCKIEMRTCRSIQIIKLYKFFRFLFILAPKTPIWSFRYFEKNLKCGHFLPTTEICIIHGFRQIWTNIGVTFDGFFVTKPHFLLGIPYANDLEIPWVCIVTAK